MGRQSKCGRLWNRFVWWLRFADQPLLVTLRVLHDLDTRLRGYDGTFHRAFGGLRNGQAPVACAAGARSTK